MQKQDKDDEADHNEIPRHDDAPRKLGDQTGRSAGPRHGTKHRARRRPAKGAGDRAPIVGVTPRRPNEPIELDETWVALLDRRARARQGEGVEGVVPASSVAAEELVALYGDWAAAPRDMPLVIGHLGQSLDGRIATDSGDSYYVTGPENLRHLHRMRALADAVVVGAGTVAADDPRLTTRLVPGDHPVRVVIDPDLRLPAHHAVLSDGAAPTLVICRDDRAGGRTQIGEAEIIGVASGQDGLGLGEIVARLQARGLWHLFVEGGGLTVSRFLHGGHLDRLQIAVAPVILGSGRHGISGPATTRMAEALRPSCRVFRMGADMLFDCTLIKNGTVS